MKNYILYFLILLSMILAGCAPGMLRSPGNNIPEGELLDNEPTVCTYSEKERCENDYLQHDHKNDYRLAFVDIDDQGHFGRQRKQLNDVLKFIKKGEKPKRIILFVHGWHHGGQEGDSNLKDFRTLLSKSSKNTEKDVVGIYISWRGDSITIPWINSLTFWERKNTSEEVGRGALFEFLVRLEQVWREEKEAGLNSNLITIGHSFGASVMLSSLKGLLIERLATASSHDPAPGFGDLVVLVNPAIEAIHYANIRDIVEEKVNRGQLKFLPNQPPRLIIATSENDLATKWLFHIGRTISTFFESQRKIERVNRHNEIEGFSQDKMDEDTVGHFDGFVTHDLWADRENLVKIGSCELKPESSEKSTWSEEKEGWTKELRYDGIPVMTLKHKENSSAYNPYWVVKVNKNVIPNHNNILRGNFICFIKKFLPEGY